MKQKKEQLIFSTNNLHKLIEVKSILKDDFEIKGLKEIGCDVDIPETGATLQENALIKARYLWTNYGVNCFADDTGLEVLALGNEPGVFSARYAGENCIAEDNVAKLLKNLTSQSTRKAQFRTVIALVWDGKEYLFEGQIGGSIALNPRGENGFGYDPIFIPDGYNQTFAELGDLVKNKISHRALAVEKLCLFLKNPNK